MRRWRPEGRGKLMRWIKLWGLPLEFWTIRAIEKIGEMAGRLMEIDEERLHQARVDWGRVAVIPNGENAVEQWIMVEINGERISIFCCPEALHQPFKTDDLWEDEEDETRQVSCFLQTHPEFSSPLLGVSILNPQPGYSELGSLVLFNSAFDSTLVNLIEEAECLGTGLSTGQTPASTTPDRISARKGFSVQDNFPLSFSPHKAASADPPSVSKPKIAEGSLSKNTTPGDSSRLAFHHCSPRSLEEALKKLNQPEDAESSSGKGEDFPAMEWMEERNNFMERSYRRKKNEIKGRLSGDNTPEIEGTPPLVN